MDVISIAVKSLNTTDGHHEINSGASHDSNDDQKA